MERINIMTALVGKTIGGITLSRQGYLNFHGTDPREGVLFTVACAGLFDAEGNFFNTEEVKDEDD